MDEANRKFCSSSPVGPRHPGGKWRDEVAPWDLLKGEGVLLFWPKRGSSSCAARAVKYDQYLICLIGHFISKSEYEVCFEHSAVLKWLPSVDSLRTVGGV